MFHDLLGLVDLERTAAVLEVTQGERTVAVTLIAHHLDVRHVRFARVLLTEQLAQAAIARLVVDRIHKQLGFSLVVGNREEPEIAHQFRRQELANERLVLEIAHGEIKGFAPVRACDFRKPPPIFRRRVGADPLQILEHREPHRVGVDVAEATLIEAGLPDDVGVRL